MIPADELPRKSAPALPFLQGIRIVDLTTSIAGPYATQLLADLGATVLKLENPSGGDDARAWGPPFLDGESLWYLSVNRNKHSMTLDFTRDEGYEVLTRLVEKADVFVLNAVPRIQAKLRVDYATLRVVKPDLVHASITGFGLRDRRADWPCYDLIAEGYSGVMDMTGEPDSPPQKIGTPAADLLAGEDAALGILAALIRRQRDGTGCQIDVSLVESMTRFLSPRLLPYLGSGELLRRSGARDSVIAIYQVFDTADLPMTLGLGSDAIWRRFWQAVGEPERAADPNHSSNAQRRQHRAETVARIGDILITHPRAHWLTLFEKARVPAGPIYRLDETARDPGLLASGLIYAFERNGFRVPQVGLGVRFDERSEGCCKPPPKLGEDTAEALRQWLDIPESELQRLRNDNLI